MALVRNERDALLGKTGNFLGSSAIFKCGVFSFFFSDKSSVTISNNMLKYIPEIWEGSSDKGVNTHIPDS